MYPVRKYREKLYVRPAWSGTRSTPWPVPFGDPTQFALPEEFQQPVAADAQRSRAPIQALADKVSAWFVPAVKDERRFPVNARLVVARTRDGGASFETLTDGLPQVPAYDLVYRHGLAVDNSGDQLAFGSTTGGLWTSNDQGDHWQPLPARLPPIHAVSFVSM